MKMELELPVPVDKIKREKMTPEKEPPQPPEIIDAIIPKLFQDEDQSKNNQNQENDEKKSVGPLKSSNEILAELFQVFNAGLPALLETKRKHKKSKKKSKKHKKSGKSSDSETDDGQIKDRDSRKRKRKGEDEKRKKSKKHKKSRSKSPKSEIVVKKEERETTPVKKDDKPTAEKKSEESSKTGKIVFKDLKNSVIFSEVSKLETKRKEEKDKRSKSSRKKDKHRDKDDDSSSLSLSDEETYERERNRFITNRDHHKRDSYHKGRVDDFRSSYREERLIRRNSDGKRSRSPEDCRAKIDKKKLLEIARRNAMTMLKNGTFPGNILDKEKFLNKMRNGEKSIEELTDFCKKLANGETLNDLSDLSSGDSDHDHEGKSKAFHHPFVLKDRGPIVMNIKNSVPITPRTADQTKAILQQFPVSSGQHHRQTESEWVPVEPKKPEPIVKEKPKKLSQEQMSKTFYAIEAEKPPTPIPQQAVTYPTVPPPPVPDNIFPDTSQAENLDVSTIISQRLNAMRKLQENPQDPDAMALMHNTQKEMSVWATSKFTPGKFMGSTGANVLSVKELQKGGIQPWAKRDAFIKSAPVSGGKGMHLLQKMGWKPGEALGKEKTGSLEPLLLEIKLDRKGLLSNEEELIQSGPKKKRPNPNNIAMTQQSLENKHPVSLLGELASKRKWGAPMYEVVDESGPCHHKSFLCQVVLNGVVYTPTVPSNNKKDAKKNAAKVCLEQLGILIK